MTANSPTFAKGLWSLVGNHRPAPSAACDAVRQRRQHAFHPCFGFEPRPAERSGVSAPCVALRHWRCFSALARSSRIHLPALPFLGRVLLAPPSVVHAPYHNGTMRALTPAALRRRRRSLRSVRLPSRHPVPNHVMQPGGHVPITSCHRSALADQTSPPMSKLASARRRIGFVILRAVGSPKAALHPASRRRSCLRLHVR